MVTTRVLRRNHPLETMNVNTIPCHTYLYPFICFCTIFSHLLLLPCVIKNPKDCLLTQLGCCHSFSCLFCCLHSFCTALQRNWRCEQALILHYLAGAFTMDLFSKLSDSFWHSNSRSCWLVLFGHIRFFVDGVGKMSNRWCDGNNPSVIATLITLWMYLTPIPTTQENRKSFLLPKIVGLCLLSCLSCLSLHNQRCRRRGASLWTKAIAQLERDGCASKFYPCKRHMLHMQALVASF